MAPMEKKPVRPVTKLATALPGALGAVLLVGAVAFGSSSLRGLSVDTGAQAKPSASVEEVTPKFGATAAAHRKESYRHDPRPEPAKSQAPKPTGKAAPQEPKATPTEQPKEQAKADPTAKPQPAPAEKQQPAPTEKAAPPAPPAPAPQTGTLALQAWTEGKKAKLSWTAFSGADFAYYKVVRSGDSHIEFPTSGDDQVIGAIGDPAATWHADKPTCGAPAHYATFAVAKHNGAYVVLAVSNVVSVVTECPPAPEPIVVKPLAFQVAANAGAGLTLSWEACWSDMFVAYKVVRSQVNPDPRFPLNDGTELIAAIGDPNQTLFVDGVEAGQTWTYRVVAVTKRDGAYVAICETPATAATAQ